MESGDDRSQRSMYRAAMLSVGIFGLLATGFWFARSQPFLSALPFGRFLDSEARRSWQALQHSPDAPALDTRSALLTIDLERINERSLAWLHSKGAVDSRAENIAVLGAMPGYRPSAWRPVLWRAVFPRAHKANGIQAAINPIASYVAAHIRIRPEADDGLNIQRMWEAGHTDRRGLAVLTMAALMSVDIPARLTSEGAVEVLTGGKWIPVTDFARCYEILDPTHTL